MAASMLPVYRPVAPRRAKGGRSRGVDVVDPFDLRTLPALYHLADDRRALGQCE